MRTMRRWITLTLAFASLVSRDGRGQQPTVDTALALLDVERGDAAMWELLDAGDAAVAPIRAALHRSLRDNPHDLPLARELVRLLGFLGRDATPATRDLVALATTGPPVLHEDCLQALGEVGRFASRAERDAVLGQLRDSPRPTYRTITKLEFADLEVGPDDAEWHWPGWDEAWGECLSEVPAYATPSWVRRIRNECVAAWGKQGDRYRRAALAWERVFLAVAPDDPEVVHTCANLLQHPDPRVRMDALVRLAALGPQAESACPQLAGALRDGSLRVARTAALLLGTFGSRSLEAEGALRKAMGRPGLEASVQAALVMLQRNDARDRQTLTAAELAVDEYLRATAADRARLADALSRLGAVVVPELERALWNQPFDAARAGLRDDLVLLLADIGPAAAPALPGMLWWAGQRRDSTLRPAVATMLARTGPDAFRHAPDLLNHLAAWHDLPGDAVDVAVTGVCRSEDQLGRCLLTWNAKVCGAACRRLLAFDALQPETVAALSDIVVRNDWSWSIADRTRATAAAAALPHLEGPESRRQAWGTLVRHGTREMRRAAAKRLLLRGVADVEFWALVASDDDPETAAVAGKAPRK